MNLSLPLNSMNKNEDTFSFADLALAIAKLVPKIPHLMRNNAKLSKASASQKLSTGVLFEEMAARHPDKPFLLFEQQKWTYSRFNAWVNQIAHYFQKNGIARGDCIAMMFENRPELLACVLAAHKIGAIAGMLNHHQKGDVLSHSIGLIKPKMIVAGYECIESISPLQGLLSSEMTFHWYGVGQAPVGFNSVGIGIALEPSTNLPQTKEITLREKCYYIFTSGTTGLPKAASMTHYRWYKAGLGMGVTAMRLTQDDVMYCPLPLYHNNALTVALSSVITSGGALALTPKFSASRFWQDVREHGATSFIYVGELCRYLLNAPPLSSDQNHKVRVIVGNGMRSEIWENFQKRFGIKHICEFYGASENNTAFINAFNLKRTAGYCPTSYAVIEVDPESEEPTRRHPGGFMQRVAKGHTGLLITEVTSTIPFDGYSDKKATEAKLFRDVFAKGDAWFNTGDLVRDQGFRHIAFVDRLGDTFRWKGENVATTEVEGILMRHPGIADAIVYGVSIPETDGRAGMAAITLAPQHVFDPTELSLFLQEHLPGYAIPLFIRLTSEQETTATFKAKKGDLKREGYAQCPTDPVYTLVDREHGYQPLTATLAVSIQEGKTRF